MGSKCGDEGWINARVRQPTLSLTGLMLVQGFVLACDISLQTPYGTLNSHKAPTSASFINLFLKMYLSKTVTLPQRAISECSPSYQGTLFLFFPQ